MAESDHDPEAYRLLFALIGAGMLLLVLAFIIVSGLVVPVHAIVGLLVLWAAAAAVSVVYRRRRPWLPLVAGTVVAVVWIVVITAGSAIFDWRP